MSINTELEIEKYSRDPEALIALLDSVIDKLVPATANSDLSQKQVQLSEVARSIDQLTKLSIPIPDELRNLKLNLFTEIDNLSQNREELERTVAQLGEIVARFEVSYSKKPSKQRRARKDKSKTTLVQATKDQFEDEIIDVSKIIGGSKSSIKAFESAVNDALREIRVRRSSKEVFKSKIVDASKIKVGRRTSKEVFVREIIDALLVLRGRGSDFEINEIVKVSMKDRFLPGDFDLQARGELSWENSLRWIRLDMKKAGILRSDSPRGIWELSEDYE